METMNQFINIKDLRDIEQNKICVYDEYQNLIGYGDSLKDFKHLSDDFKENAIEVSFPEKFIFIDKDAFKDCENIETFDFSKVKNPIEIWSFEDNYSNYSDKIKSPDGYVSREDMNEVNDSLKKIWKDSLKKVKDDDFQNSDEKNSFDKVKSNEFDIEF